MLTIPCATWSANAAAGLTSLYGEVTRQAEVADWSRQTIYDPAQKVQAALEDAHDGGPTRATLIEQNQQLRHENAQLGDWVAQTTEFPPSQQRESSVTAAAMGLSLNPVLVLLTRILGTPAGPGRSPLHRGITTAALAAGRVVTVLDAQCQTLVLVGCLDEIFFHGRPVLVGIEPASRAWFLGQKAIDRTGATGAKASRRRDALSYVTADAGTGLQAGSATVPQERQNDAKPAWENGLDVFPTTQEARRVLRPSWSPVERLWERAEAAPRRVDQAQRQGPDARGAAVAARWAGKKAEAAFPQYERREVGGKRAHGALSVFRPEGQWNDRAWAEQEIALALPLLSGRAWSKVRGFLEAQETLTFRDRLHRQLGAAVPEGPWRAEWVRWWWLRRQRPRANTAGAVVGDGPVADLVQQTGLARTLGNIGNI